MHFKICIFIVIAAHLAHIFAQTPPYTIPATSNPLTVTYGSTPVTYGSTPVTPGDLLPRTLTSTIPTFSYISTTPNTTYTLLLIDLSINALTIDTSSLNPTYQLPLAPGISANRTTLLHFWQAGLTFTANGTLVNTTSPIAFYAAPSPPPADIPHSYVFYLFEQKAGFAPPPEDSPFSPDNVSKSPGNRRSFNVQGFTQEKGVGDLVAGNYFQVVNTTGSAGSSASASAGGGTTASATGSVTAPTAPSFTGAAVKAGIGAVGGSMMVAGFAMILLLG